MSAHETCKRIPGVVVLGVLAQIARAQQVVYLAPAKYEAGIGERVALRLEVGEGLQAQAVAWPADRIEWLCVRATGTQENLHAIQATGPEKRDVVLPPVPAGVTLVGVDFRPAVLQIPGRDWQAFARRRVAADLAGEPELSRPDATVRVRRVESAKALIRARGSDGAAAHSQVAQSKSGQAVEIRPLADPTMVPVGSDLAVRAYVDGSSKADVRVFAAALGSGKTQEAKTDATGSCHFRITDAGVWRVEFHHAERAKGDPSADWILYSATLTFNVAAEGAGQ